MRKLIDVSVVGLGPAGTIAAYRAAQLGHRVRGFDPQGRHAPGTIALWAHQLPSWFPTQAIAARFRPMIITANNQRVLNSEYVILAADWTAHLDGFEEINEYYLVEEDPTHSLTLRTAPTSSIPVRQLAYGLVVPESIMSQQHPVIMDFSAVPGFSQDPTTFNYRIPLGDGTWLIEETILASKKTAAEMLSFLSRKLEYRMRALGIQPQECIGTEEVQFPLAPKKIDKSGLPIGTAGGWMHPATGYSVGSMLHGTDNMLQRVFSGKNPTSWSWRMNYRLRLLGLHALLKLNPAQTQHFFDSVFSLEEKKLMAYLTGDKPTATSQSMLQIFGAALSRDPSAAATVIKAVLLRDEF